MDMMDYDEGDKGEWTYKELEKQIRDLKHEIQKLRLENIELKHSRNAYKVIAELWERTAKRKTKTWKKKLKQALRLVLRRMEENE
jgi:hypothetical protein